MWVSVRKVLFAFYNIKTTNIIYNVNNSVVDSCGCSNRSIIVRERLSIFNCIARTYIKKSSVGKVNYIVGVKKGKSVTFLLVQIGLDNLIASFGVEPNPKSVSYQKIRKLLVLAKNATQLESEMQSFKFGATDPVYGGAKDLGTIDASDALKVSKLVLEDVNKQFENLIKNLQILTKEVNELTYVAKDKKQRKTKAGTSAAAAGETKKSAEEIK